MKKLTFDKFTKKIYIKASLEKLYSCWCSKVGIESWFLQNAVFKNAHGKDREPGESIQVGDRYEWKWHNWDGKEEGTILQANGKDFLEFTFANDICKVSITLEEQENAVLLTLIQYDMPTDEKTKMNIYNGCSCGWTFWLTNLKSYLEHGIVLNERDVDLTNIPQAGHIFVNM
ncbi:MAG: SRPBCC domain-containing protein [Allomuricauda sp.]|nr:MAG: SRPBCC domain-containing protein [Allomuricauda sp.]